MERAQTLDNMTAGIMAKLESMPPVDIGRLRAEYQTENADKINAHKKHMADMRAVCRVFEGRK